MVNVRETFKFERVVGLSGPRLALSDRGTQQGRGAVSNVVQVLQLAIVVLNSMELIFGLLKRRGSFADPLLTNPQVVKPRTSVQEI